MKKWLTTFFALFTLAGACCISAAATGNDKVQVQSIADTTAVVPGKSFLIGFKFTIEPGWHIYWTNPGDSGLPTQVKLTLPSGFTASELMFPVPSRLQLAGDILNYAYENQVMLMVRITPPKDLPAGQSVKIGAKASWLVCQEECLPGQGDASLELPVADTASAANADAFKQWTDQLPMKEDPQEIASLSKSISVSNGDGQAIISVGWKKAPTDAQFIPGALKNGDVMNIKTVTDGDLTKITFVIKGFKGDEPVTGLVTFTSPTGEKRGIAISASTAH